MRRWVSAWRVVIRTRYARRSRTTSGSTPAHFSQVSRRLVRHSVVQAAFKLDPAAVAEEVRRAETTGTALREQGGFLSFDVMAPDEETVVVTQLWTSRHAFLDGMNGMRDVLGQLASAHRQHPRGVQRRGRGQRALSHVAPRFRWQGSTAPGSCGCMTSPAGNCGSSPEGMTALVTTDVTAIPNPRSSPPWHIGAEPTG
ncbi:antibiotic biosynthesis monooxygenase [Streptomyces sp. NPDC085479]|uniref:antibiotic biosynthesis monooxygenase n=1 Tax=Streptomyces sp. NPDC085479 TaxID=3365726 RepID=UPI0037D93632